MAITINHNAKQYWSSDVTEDSTTPARDWTALVNLSCLLLFGSGLAALTYQTVWMREFRLVFGASTASTAAVSALFMAGLGVGGYFLGPRADREERPLLFYAKLEFAIAVLALLSPLLLWITRQIYLASGGMMVLGLTGATLARLLLAAIVVGIPAFLMGGTLPAAVRAVTSESDGARRSLGSLYGVNTLGALLGVILTTFVALEYLGARWTLFLAVIVNLFVAWCAKIIAGKQPPIVAAAAAKKEPAAAVTAPDAPGGGLSPKLALATAAGVGFAFFLMELVWYRMLAPVLGGSTYTFGLILAVALAGIGLGGAAYPVIMRGRLPSAWHLAVTCLLEALLMLIPYAAGDWVAAITAQLLSLSAMGFAGIVGAWFLVAVAVVFPAAFVSGVQFPLLIALLGRGAKDIGRQTGRAYALNTIGAILGSLAGGFGLIPRLTAPGCWILVGVLLTLFGVLIAARALSSPGESRERRRDAALAVCLMLLLIGTCLLAQGPTAAWRHSPVGAGRTQVAKSLEEVKAWMVARRWALEWEADGVESAVGIMGDQGYAFLVNGKSDGNVIGDRGTQIMCAMLGAALHPEPKKALVVGLGTGCTAGWLAEIRGMERVDVVELEPAVLRMAELCAPANRDVVAKANEGRGVRIIVNDAREVLNTIPERYDVIASEPSNPYRAGIASLFTREFYEEVKSRLAPGGLFVSWCQAYEIDTETVFTILATLKTVFPHVECWATQKNDLAFIASTATIAPDPEALAQRVREPAFRDAMRIGWGMDGVEGLLGRFVATDAFIAEALAAGHDGGINTDDLMRVEYDYARTVGRTTNFSVNDFYQTAAARGQALPAWVPDTVDMERVQLNQGLAGPVEGSQTTAPANFPEAVVARLRRVEQWRQGQFAEVIQNPLAVVKPPHRLENLAMAESLAWGKDDKALAHLAAFEGWWPACAAFVRARLAIGKDDTDGAVAELEKACRILRRSPWEIQATVDRGLGIVTAMAKQKPEYAERLYEAMFEPFALRFLEAKRRGELVNISAGLSAEKRAEVFRRWFEPATPRNLSLLEMRARSYREVGDALAGQAERDLADFLSGRRRSVSDFAAAPKK